MNQIELDTNFMVVDLVKVGNTFGVEYRVTGPDGERVAKLLPVEDDAMGRLVFKAPELYQRLSNVLSLLESLEDLNAYTLQNLAKTLGALQDEKAGIGYLLNEICHDDEGAWDD